MYPSVHHLYLLYGLLYSYCVVVTYIQILGHQYQPLQQETKHLRLYLQQYLIHFLLITICHLCITMFRVSILSFNTVQMTLFVALYIYPHRDQSIALKTRILKYKKKFSDIVKKQRTFYCLAISIRDVKIYQIISNSKSDIYGMQELYEENNNLLDLFERCEVQLAYGYNLLNMCKNNDLFILNGRIGSDFTCPTLTCKNKSPVDYFISSAHILPIIKDLQVHEFSCLLSDAHSPVSFAIDVNYIRKESKPKCSSTAMKQKLC